MGSYITSTANLGALMIGTNFSDSDVAALGNRAIAYAEATVRSYVAAKYDVSGWALTTVPPLIRSTSEILATAYVYRFMSRGSKEQHSRADNLEKMALNTLEAIRDCTQYLHDTAGTLIDTIMDDGTYTVKSSTEDYTGFADVDSTTSWKVDSDQLDDIADER